MPLVPYRADAPAPAALASAPAARVLRERLVETFERHVRCDSASDRHAATLPTTAMQRDFAAEWVESLRVKSAEPTGEVAIALMLKERGRTGR